MPKFLYHNDLKKNNRKNEKNLSNQLFFLYNVFYIQNNGFVKDQRIEYNQDRSPDLSINPDITRLRILHFSFGQFSC